MEGLSSRASTTEETFEKRHPAAIPSEGWLSKRTRFPDHCFPLYQGYFQKRPSLSFILNVTECAAETPKPLIPTVDSLTPCTCGVLQISLSGVFISFLFYSTMKTRAIWSLSMLLCLKIQADYVYVSFTNLELLSFAPDRKCYL